MSVDQPGRLRVTVLGCSTAAPHADGPAAAFLVEFDGTTVLLDVGQGSIRRLQRMMDPTDLGAVIVGHMHADHYLDLVGLRYLFPWGEPARRPIPLFLPPGGAARLAALETAISERVGFFDGAYDVVEYDADRPLRIGPLLVRFVQGRHYVPAWGVVVEAPDGSRLAYTGDTGPSDAVVNGIADADLLLIEAAIRRPVDDDLERGHLSAEEAVDMAARAGARAALLVHYAPARRAELTAMCTDAGPWIRPAVAGMTVTVGGLRPVGRASGYAPRRSPSAAAAREM